jgi:hypothetical protein
VHDGLISQIHPDAVVPQFWPVAAIQSDNLGVKFFHDWQVAGAAADIDVLNSIDLHKRTVLLCSL